MKNYANMTDRQTITALAQGNREVAKALVRKMADQAHADLDLAEALFEAADDAALPVEEVNYFHDQYLAAVTRRSELVDLLTNIELGAI